MLAFKKYCLCSPDNKSLGRYYYYFHFTGGETETHRVDTVCSNSHR